MSTALLILHEGFEEMEAIAPIDILRRAEVELTVASREEGLQVTGKCGVTVQADAMLEDVLETPFDLLVLPGGPGTARSREDERVLDLVRRHAGEGKLIGAICAAPTILAAAGVLEGKRYTAHISVKDTLPDIIEDQAVVVDGNIVTSRGAGTACEFGLALAARTATKAVAQNIEKAIHRLPKATWQ